MRRLLKPEEVQLWGKVAATVRPFPGRAPPPPVIVAEPPSAPPPQVVKTAGAKPPQPAKPKPKTPPRPSEAPQLIEPGRLRRAARERDPVAGVLDLHGLDQDQARARLVAFLRRAQAEGGRLTMVITGKGVSGDGILRRRAPEWLASAELREVVAGVAEAHRRHGGAGALYVALKRRVKG